MAFLRLSLPYLPDALSCLPEGGIPSTRHLQGLPQITDVLHPDAADDQIRGHESAGEDHHSLDPWLPPDPLSELPFEPSDVPQNLLDGILLDWASISQQALPIGGDPSGMGLGFQEEYTAFTGDHQVIDVPVRAFEVVDDEEAIPPFFQDAAYLLLRIGPSLGPTDGALASPRDPIEEVRSQADHQGQGEPSSPSDARRAALAEEEGRSDQEQAATQGDRHQGSLSPHRHRPGRCARLSSPRLPGDQPESEEADPQDEDPPQDQSPYGKAEQI